MQILLIVIGGILLRLVPHIPNFAPVTATALFGGAYFNKKYALIVPILTMVTSDYLLLYIGPHGVDLSHIHPISSMFHSTTLYVWGSFGFSGLIGLWLRKDISIKNLIIASFVASLQFFMITNFGVWAGGMYNRGLDGLAESYIMGLPFFKWTLLGDLFYISVFFGSYALATRLSQKTSPIIQSF